MERSARYPATLLAAFALWWCLLGYAPAHRRDWLPENLLVLVAVPLLVGVIRACACPTEGDIWDAQKDSAMAALGATLGLVVVRLRPGALIALRPTAP